MRFFLIFVITCFVAPLSFAQSQRSTVSLYDNYLKGLLYAEKGEYLKSLEELERAKTIDPQSIHIRLKIASVLVHLDRFDEAKTLLKEAKMIDPNNLDISLALIFVYSYSENNDDLEIEYEDFLNKAHGAKPKDVSISEYLAQFYFYKKRPQEAIKVYEKILENNPDYVEALFWLGNLYEDCGQRSKALEKWEKGIKLEPTSAPILNCLGYTYAQEGVKLDLAEEMVKKALKEEPDNGAYLDSLGWIYYKKGDLDKAKQYVLRAIELIRDPDVYEHIGDIYIGLKDQEQGVRYYQEGLTQFPGDKDLELKLKKHGKENKIPKG